ncbi:hypothetical protein OBBRIDRAFT_730037 [Obba rivulosa]|uniref:Uncharacterized protein n=1 Tax=Obba rivulosa TaxID=1052685 RepID=A0A8E2DNQ1_9APHY|nr:hypothetical protein OBBRIDRAFT_730037 [Obba rivulosa]
MKRSQISTCAAFQSMLQANIRNAKGLSVTGVGGCTCALHKLWWSNGIGNLQHSKRYV